MTASLSNCCCVRPPGTQKNNAAAMATENRAVQRFAAIKIAWHVERSFIQCLAPYDLFHDGNFLFPAKTSAAQRPRYTESATPCPLYPPRTIIFLLFKWCLN